MPCPSGFPIPNHLRPHPPGSPAGDRSSGKSPESIRPPWIQVTIPDLRTVRRRRQIPPGCMVSRSSARQSPGYSVDEPRRTSGARACDTSHLRHGGALHTGEWRTNLKISGSVRAARYGQPRLPESFGTRNKEGSGSTEDIRDSGVISPSTPPRIEIGSVCPTKAILDGKHQKTVDRREKVA
jgi:hypothetical protein